MSDNRYKIKLVDGPLEGVELNWKWNDDFDGQIGEAAGVVLLSYTDVEGYIRNARYDCNREKTEAKWHRCG